MLYYIIYKIILYINDDDRGYSQPEAKGGTRSERMVECKYCISRIQALECNLTLGQLQSYRLQIFKTKIIHLKINLQQLKSRWLTVPTYWFIWTYLEDHPS